MYRKRSHHDLKTGIYEFEFNFNLRRSTMIKRCRFDRIEQEVEQNLSLNRGSRRGSVRALGKIFCLPSEGEKSHAIELLRTDGYEPAEGTGLLAFAAAFPQAQRQSRIIGLGANLWINLGTGVGRAVLCLDSELGGTKRILSYTDATGIIWSVGDHFLGIRYL